MTQFKQTQLRRGTGEGCAALIATDELLFGQRSLHDSSSLGGSDQNSAEMTQLRVDVIGVGHSAGALIP